jgi:hypothetical protein
VLSFGRLYARGLHGGGILLRVDPASGRPAGWLRDPLWSFQEVLAAGPRGAWVATAAPELLHVVADVALPRTDQHPSRP